MKTIKAVRNLFNTAQIISFFIVLAIALFGVISGPVY